MAKEYELKLLGQPYYGNCKERTYNICFTEPEEGITKETGILLLVAGFGGNINSNVYRKIRNIYSDKYDMIVIQADYMGSRCQQAPQNHSTKDVLYDETEWTVEEIEDFLHDRPLKSGGRKKTESLDIILDSQETEDDFAEMGIFQAMDNIRAVKVVVDIVKDNGYEFNENKIVGFGDSHGAYLLYVINRLCPEMLTTVIDNSAWLFPVYIDSIRKFEWHINEVHLIKYMSYRLGDIIKDRQVYDLRYLYKNFVNKANIYSFHGKDDALIELGEKEEFIKNMENAKLHRIGIDFSIGEIFKNTKHSMGTDYLKLLDYIFENYPLEKSKRKGRIFSPSVITTSKFQYDVSVKDNECKIERTEIR